MNISVPVIQVIFLITTLFALVRLVFLDLKYNHTAISLAVHGFSVIINFIPTRYILKYEFTEALLMSFFLGMYYIWMIRLVVVSPMYYEDTSWLRPRY